MDDDFGNYLIRGIQEISMPDPVLWLPTAPGWRVVAVLLLLFGCYKLVRSIQRWRRNRYRREALRHLNTALATSQEEALQQLPLLLKACALHAYAREEVAALSGQAWCAFLDSRYTGPSFTENGLLPQVAYAPPTAWQGKGEVLLTMARLWIKTHREAAHV